MTCKKIKNVSFFLILLICKPAFAWEKYKTFDVWIDKESIYSENIKGNKDVHIWVMSNMKLPNPQNSKSVKSLVDIECKTHYVSADSFFYSGNEGSGVKMVSGYWEGASIEPDSLYSELLKEYCKDWWKVW